MKADEAQLLDEPDAPHLTRLGLLSEPFAGSDGPYYFYADANREQRLDLMQHLAPYSEVLVVIGTPGVGKTTLLQQFAARGADSWQTAVVSAYAGISREEFLQQLMEGFAVPAGGAFSSFEESRAALVEHLHALRQRAQVLILLIDDAHHLDDDVMELVLGLCEENQDGHLLSVILFGTPQLQTNLARPVLAPLQSRVAHTFDIPPLSEPDTSRYIRHRMRAAGARDEGPFTPEVVAKIYAATGGIPSSINEMAHYRLTEMAGGAASSRPGQAAMPSMNAPPARGGADKRWIAAGVAAVAIIAVVVVGRYSGEPPAANKTTALPLPPPDDGSAARVMREPTPPGESSAATAALPETTVSVEQAQTALAPAPPDSAPAPAAAVPGATSLANPPPLPPPTAKAEVVAPPPSPLRRAAAAAPKSAAASGIIIRRDDWVLAQPPASYTLQLMALKDENTVRETIDRYSLQEAAYFPIQRNGETLYILVHGVYPSRSAANAAIKTLPTALAAGPPWVRSFRTLQSEIGKP